MQLQNLCLPYAQILEDLWREQNKQKRQHALHHKNAARTLDNRFDNFAVELANTTQACVRQNIAVKTAVMVEEIGLDREHKQRDGWHDGHGRQEHGRVIIREEA